MSNLLTTLERVQILLRESGAIAEQARISGKPLSNSDQLFITQSKQMGREINLSEEVIDSHLERGAQMVRRAMSV